VVIIDRLAEQSLEPIGFLFGQVGIGLTGYIGNIGDA
jgi:hypothetical protein